MRRSNRWQRERGGALWLVLALVALTGSFTLYRTAHSHFQRQSQEAKLTAVLARAKEALIARAATDDNRPGSLPCPDLITNNAGLNNVPGDGKADMFTLTQCPSYVGWLPWVTLDLPELTDPSGSRLWYVLAPALRDDDSASPINSDTSPGLSVDGNTHQDIAALIIAPGAPLAGQERPSLNPAAYLDGENGNGDSIYVTAPGSDRFNDRVLLITRQELMAAVEKRVANEVRSCLEQHATAPSNLDHRTPWPAPLSAVSAQGQTNSLFGRIPSTQPGAGPQAALQQSQQQLAATLQQLGAAGTASAQLLASKTLNEQVVAMRNLFDAIFLAANPLKQSADAAANRLTTLDSTVDAAVLNERISRSEGTTIRTQADSADSAIATLLSQIEQFGSDALPWQLKQRALELGAAADAAQAAAITQSIRDVLLITATPRPDLQTALSAALATSVAACNSLQFGQACAQSSAQGMAGELISGLRKFQSAIEASRVNLLADDVSAYAGSLNSLSKQLEDNPDAANLAALAEALVTYQSAVAGLSTGVPTVITARDAASNILAAAITAARSNDHPQAIDSARTAISQLQLLAEAIAANEALDNNLSHSSLRSARDAYQNANNEFVVRDTATVRPTQESLTPYATSLGQTAVNLQIWAKMIAAHAAQTAILAKAKPQSAGSDPAKAIVLADSAYQAANNTLASLGARKGTIALLETYLSKPNATNQNAAAAALNTTLNQANLLLAASQQLAQDLSTTQARAFPMVWLASRCDFLLPNKSSWWRDNQWTNSIFYQSSGPLQHEPGKLTINGRPGYRMVVIAAGRSLAGQNRATASTAQFFEGVNADPSRDGDATAPAPHFAASSPSATANDRLSF